ncbi:MAG TPA: RHS repeat-associated core domain-containing protein, partial [Candidatus Paceibacterota bacterium]|nr:RHS repeat-associated core domain-containing protein [Candidatus Paceibacterota bacterium]
MPGRVSYDCSISRVEHPIYGLGREGVARLTYVDLDSVPTGNMYTRRLDERLYELNDHLGNARAIISDRKLSDVSGGSSYHFRAEISSYNNLYPFGMEQPKRYVHSDLYRYGYTGMEKDSTASQDHYSTYFRPYDARLGRWWGVDPVTHPGESPYVAMGDDPVDAVDPSGADTVTRQKNAIIVTASRYSPTLPTYLLTLRKESPKCGKCGFRSDSDKDCPDAEMIASELQLDRLNFDIGCDRCKQMIGLRLDCLGRRFRNCRVLLQR